MIDLNRGRRPSIHQVGNVRDDGHLVVISGWALGLCAAGCICHRHPVTGQLVIAEDQVGGTLGLRCFTGCCPCCEAWTAEELAAVIHNFAELGRLVVAAGLSDA